ncbi:AAA family ATPase [Ornithinibacillus scapharcae]|uniref:AAA family ATPase n=1 Tax=Ornithinibacillus scapharcae TaxID=1147159 RepID=UPI000225B402|nr:AAA family ATPase [Ornithinibacillus scapharcae]
MNINIDIPVIGNNEELLTTVLESIGEAYQVKNVSVEDLKKETHQIIIILKNDKESPLDLAQSILNEHSNTPIIFISDMPDFELLRELTRMGITDYFVLPDEEWQFLERINKLILTMKEIKTETSSSEGFIRGGGKVFTFFSGKGGSGKSLISSLFAQTLKLDSTAKVLFIDLNLQYGGAETYLGINSTRSMIDLIPVIHEISEHHIRNVSEIMEPSKLEVLVSPRDTELAERINEDFVMRLIRASKRSYDFIIIDTPSYMDIKTFTALNESDRIYYVMNQDTVSIRVLKYVDTVLKQLGLVTDERMELVMNFTGKDNELSNKDIQRFVSYPISANIKRDFKGVHASMNKGEPLRKEPKDKKLSPVAKDLKKWVRSMLK